jgi:hypothetical protein
MSKKHSTTFSEIKDIALTDLVVLTGYGEAEEE